MIWGVHDSVPTLPGGISVAEEQVIKLLEEIRDLQKLHVENYKDALKNQQEAIELQRQAVRRQRTSLFVIGIVLIIFLGFIAWSSYAPK
jgi:CHASE3 domain sensor protein